MLSYAESEFSTHLVRLSLVLYNARRTLDNYVCSLTVRRFWGPSCVCDHPNEWSKGIIRMAMDIHPWRFFCYFNALYIIDTNVRDPIMTGIATVIIACIATFFLPADISSAKFLTEEERQFARKYPSIVMFLTLLLSIPKSTDSGWKL